MRFQNGSEGSSTMTKLKNIVDEFSKYIILKDPEILRMIFAAMVGNSIIDSDPIWLLIVAPSSGGKTTLLAPLVNIPHVYFVDDLSEKSLLSGFKGKKETSLLKIIGSGHMVVSDLTSILLKNPVVKGEILSMLKLVYDGILTRYTGLGVLEWRGKIGAIMAGTPDVYEHMEAGRSTGERFTYYWLSQPTNEEIIAKQREVKISSKEITTIMAEFYAHYMEDITGYAAKHGIPELKLTPEQEQEIQHAGIFCVLAKATIRRDFKSGKPDAIPNIAGAGRDIKIFSTVLRALLLMKTYEQEGRAVKIDDSMIHIIKKCAYSAVNRERRKVLEILVGNGGSLTGSQIGAYAGLGLEKDAVEQYLHPLHAVGLIKKSASSGAHKWYIDDPSTISFVKEVSENTKDNAPVPELAQEEDLLEQFYSQQTGGEEPV